MTLPLSGRNALVLGVERPLGRKAAVALAEAGANVAVVTLSEDTKAEFAANSTANEFWALGRKGIALTSDGGETAVKEAIAGATVELGPISILVWHGPVVPRETLAGLRSDAAIVVLLGSESEHDESAALLEWTRALADRGLRANALLASSREAPQPMLKQHHAPEPMDIAGSVVYLASDASAAVEGAMVVASEG